MQPCHYTLTVYRLDEHLNVKVADFGLSRDVYINEYYAMNRSIPLPIKWLAPEALFDKVFSEKTDVVSFHCNQLYSCMGAYFVIVGIWSDLLGNIFTWITAVSFHRPF